MAADLALTGMLHLDGLADSADGLLPPPPRDRRLAVMRSPEVGAFGVAAVTTAIGLRWVALAALIPPGGDLPPSRLLPARGAVGGVAGVMAGTLLLVPTPGGGRSGRPLPGRRRWPPRARPGRGPARHRARRGRLRHRPGVPGLVALLAGLLAAGGVVLLALRRLGGFTGDVLVAAGFLGEMAGLVAATAWS